MHNAKTVAGFLAAYDDAIDSLAEDNSWCEKTMAYFDPEEEDTSPRSIIPAPGSQERELLMADQGLPVSHFSEEGIAYRRERDAALLEKWGENVREMAAWGMRDDEEKMPPEDVNAALKTLGLKPLAVREMNLCRLTVHTFDTEFNAPEYLDAEKCVALETAIKSAIYTGIRDALAAAVPESILDTCIPRVSIRSHNYTVTVFVDDQGAG